jgi:hypothetical protein
MNVFRLLGDLSHLLAIVVLLLKIWKTRSCAGNISLVFIQCECLLCCSRYIVTSFCLLYTLPELQFTSKNAFSG